ncbi:MAG: peptidoglycan-binding domain-containing protein [Rickettsiales bacterium]|nr:peptidoglycan-binding domain-containing protein [Rickettsiales bacterium]
MEKYLNSNFAEADEQSIIGLQNYLNKLGYRNSVGKKLSVDGVFGEETKAALKQAKEDVKLYKNIKKDYKILTKNEYNTFLEKASKFTKVIADPNRSEDINKDFIITNRAAEKIFDSSINYIFFVNISSTLSEKRDYKKALAFIKNNTIFDYCLATSYPNRDQKVYLDSKMRGYNLDFKISDNYLCSDYFYTTIDVKDDNNKNGFIFCTTFYFSHIAFSNDPKALILSNFDDTKIPNAPTKKNPYIKIQNKDSLPSGVIPKTDDIPHETGYKKVTNKIQVLDYRTYGKKGKPTECHISENKWAEFCDFVEKMGKLNKEEINKIKIEIKQKYDDQIIGKTYYEGSQEVTIYYPNCGNIKGTIKATMEK